ncbi:hypothetical protein KBD71_02035 [Candidatus Woesebacteria bacterium]|nr:hypothetical protein [Candidatus Woesebacteria bacterium]
MKKESAPLPAPKKPFDPSSAILIVISIIPIIMLLKGIFELGQNVTISAQNTRMATPTPTITCTPSMVSLSSEGFVPTNVSIPALSKTLPVMTLATHDVNAPITTSSAIYSLQTNKVHDKRGNVGIYGTDTADVLGPIRKLKLNDTIILSSKEYTATYAVSELAVRTVQTSVLFATSETPTLTMVSTGKTLYQKGYTVRAKLLSLHTNCYETY